MLVCRSLSDAKMGCDVVLGSSRRQRLVESQVGTIMNKSAGDWMLLLLCCCNGRREDEQNPEAEIREESDRERPGWTRTRLTTVHEVSRHHH